MSSQKRHSSYLLTSWETFILDHPRQRQVGTLRDGYGVYGYICQGAKGRYIFCAKQSKNGVEVSCHKDLVSQAQAWHLEIYMYINGRIYRFFPEDIIRSNPITNVYHGAMMLNFSIAIGKNVEQIGKHRAPPSELTPSLFEASDNKFLKVLGDVVEPAQPQERTTV